MCSRTNMSCVLACSRANVSCVLTCSRANVSCVLMCSRAIVSYVLTCLACSCTHVSTCFACSWEKPGRMYNVYWYQGHTHTFLSCFFIFTSFNITPLTLLVKVILIQEIASQWKVTSQVGWRLFVGEQLLMLWSKISSVLQFIYGTSIYLLKVNGGNTR